ncbi:MAG: flavonol synthase [Brevundimonas subvibrioides]|uniref:Flavonol synthase n=2 Tax=Brevundimonas TaxID=41275 RepID=A0A258FS13_9CAUL|nr:MAG: flavonol synthase [Brevundimonas subvibrioides]
MTATLDALSADGQTPRGIVPVSMSRYAADFQGFSDDLGASFQRYGFAVVADHGLDEDVIRRAIDDAKAFFALPEDVKRAYHQPGTGGARGLTPFGVEAAKGAASVDLKEFWHTGRELPEGHPYRRYMRDNLWPTEIPGFRDDVYAMFEALDALGRRILKAIARYLQLDDAFFEDKVQLGNSVLRMLHYPPVPADAPGVRAGAHEDINVITLLLGAEEAGLQLKDADGEWLDIAPPPGALVVNIGDMLQRLTNHVLPSTTHRVVNPAPERRGFARYSTPFFLHFNPDYVIQTLPGTVTAQNPDRYAGKAIMAEDFLTERLREIRLL